MRNAPGPICQASARSESPTEGFPHPLVFVSVASKGLRICLSDFRMNSGSVDILPDESMPQAIEIIGEAEEEGLANLGGQATPRGTRGEFTFDDRKDGFDLGALPVRFFREGAVHLIANGAIGDPPALGGDDAPSPQALPNVLVMGFGVKLRIRQHHANGRASCRHVQQSRQIAHVGSWPAMRPLRQQNLCLWIALALDC